MEIIVIGNSRRSVSPDTVEIKLIFREKSDDYKDVLTRGTNKVIKFVNKVLLRNDFSSNDLKTNNFSVDENLVYNEDTKKYDNDGYVFTQIAYLYFDYEPIKLAKIMEDIALLDININYHINFTLKDKNKYRRSLLKNAFDDAYDQAISLGSASGLDDVECFSCERLSSDNTYYSDTKYERVNNMQMDINNIIRNTFIPEDIILEESVRCKFH